MTKVEPLNHGTAVSGFAAELADGARVWCQAAVGGETELNCGPAKAAAETPIVVSDPDDSLRGLVRTCSSQPGRRRREQPERFKGIVITESWQVNGQYRFTTYRKLVFRR